MKDGTLMEQVTDYDLRDQRTTVWEAGAFGGAAPTVQAETFSYDEVGRQTKHRNYDGSGMKRLQSTRYDDDGRVVWQANFGRSADGTGYGEFEEGEGLSLLSKVDYTQTGGYDDAGRLQGYVYGNFRHEAGGPTSGPGSFTHTYSYSYEGRDSYLERGVYGYSNNSNFKASSTSSSYDAWGRRIAIAEQTPNQDVDDRVRYFAYDGEGNILRRREGRLVNGVFHQGTEEIGQTQIYAYVSGQQVASGKYNGELDIIGRLTAYDASETGSFRVTVLAGDTLRSIAQRVYGNANLWYLLAEANAVSDDGLVEGTTIVVPNATVSANDSSTFKPFNPNDAIGNTAPTLPYIQPPPKKHCGGLAMVLMIAVAVVATVFTAGVATVGFGAGFSTIMGAGVSTMAGTVAAGATLASTMGAAALGGFVGSVASQAVGKALGVVDHFSLRGAVASGLTAWLTAGLGNVVAGGSSLGKLIESNRYGAVAGMAVGRSLAGYASNSIAGLNDAHFSWRGVAATAISSVISAGATDMLGLEADTFGNGFANGMIDGVVSLHTRRKLGFNDDIDYGAIAADAFGNAVGNGLVERSLGGAFLGPKDGRMSRREQVQELAKVNSSLRSNGEAELSSDQAGKYLAMAEIRQYLQRNEGKVDPGHVWIEDSLLQLTGGLRNRLLTASIDDVPPLMGVPSTLMDREPRSKRVIDVPNLLRMLPERLGVEGSLDRMGEEIDRVGRAIGQIESSNPVVEEAVRGYAAMKGFAIDGLLVNDVAGTVGFAVELVLDGLVLTASDSNPVFDFGSDGIREKYARAWGAVADFLEHPIENSGKYLEGRFDELSKLYRAAENPNDNRLYHDWMFGQAAGKAAYDIASTALLAATIGGLAVKGVVGVGRMFKAARASAIAAAEAAADAARFRFSTKVRGVYRSHEFDQARRFGDMYGGGEFRFGQANRQGIEGYFYPAGTAEKIPVSLKEFTTANMKNMFREIRANAGSIADAEKFRPVNNQDLPFMTLERTVLYAENKNLRFDDLLRHAQSQKMNVYGPRNYKQIIIRVPDGMIYIRKGQVYRADRFQSGE